MHVQYVTLCDQIILGQDGRPSLIGVFNHLNVPALPFTLPRLAFAGRILFTADETGRAHTVEVVITGPDGVELARPGGDISLPPAPEGLDSVAVDLPMQFDLFQVEAAGRYTFLLNVDGEKTAAVQLLVHLGAGG
jgi:hypothetical protein